MIEPSEETRRLVWDELVDSDRMCRYYGYLTLRFRQIDQLLQFVAVCAAFVRPLRGAVSCSIGLPCPA